MIKIAYRKIQKNILLFFLFLLIISMFAYFGLGHKIDWLRNILPDFIGVSILTIIFFFTIKSSIPLKILSIVYAAIFLTSVGLYILGIQRDIEFLIDVSPELIVTSIVGIIIAIFFKKKVLV